MCTPPDDDAFWHWLGYQVGSSIIPLLFLIGLPWLMIQACDAIFAQDREGPRCSEIVENLADFSYGTDVLREIGRARILGGWDDFKVQKDAVDGAKCVQAAAVVKNDAGAQALSGCPLHPRRGSRARRHPCAHVVEHRCSARTSERYRGTRHP